MGAYLPSLTPSTTAPCLGSPPANSQCTKQFLSRLHGLQLFLSEGAELLTMAEAWRQASLSPIGHLGSHIWLPAARLCTFLTAIWPLVKLKKAQIPFRCQRESFLFKKKISEKFLTPGILLATGKQVHGSGLGSGSALRFLPGSGSAKN